MPFASIYIFCIKSRASLTLYKLCTDLTMRYIHKELIFLLF